MSHFTPRRLMSTTAFAALALTGALAACTAAPPAAEAPPAPPLPPPVVMPAPSPPPPPHASMAASRMMMMSADGYAAMPAPPPPMLEPNTERFPDAAPNPVRRVLEEPVSTFSIDVDTASYAFTRASLTDGTLPPRDAVRIEELINYFDYNYPAPATGDAPFAVSARVVPSPWNADAQLLHIGLEGYDVVPEARPRSNLVFLLDVSGSMNDPAKLPLLKKSLRLMVEELRPEDTVAIVVYAGAAGAVLEPTSDKRKILAALDSLEAGGSTAGGEGLRLAYALAERGFDENAINRVILATDGDFNVGVVDDDSLEDFIARKRDSGVYLSVLGFGRGNYNDALMQTLAQAGNGSANYIDTLQEARKVLADELASTLFPIANDVKIQMEFNPAKVAEYRLIGYETRMLRREDFSNDRVDAGDIGSGHQVTAIYEIAAPDSASLRIEPGRYEQLPAAAGVSDEFGFLRIRYKTPGEGTSQLIERPITTRDAVDSLERADAETRFAVAVAGFGQLLRLEPYLNDFGYGDVLALAQGARGADPFGYRAEFIQLVRAAETAAALPEANRNGGQAPY